MPNPKTLLIALFCVTFTASSLALADNQSGGNAPARSTARSQPAHATTPPRLTSSPPTVVADAPARPVGGTQPTRTTTPPRLTPNPPTIVADTPLRPSRPTTPPRLTPNSPTIVADAPQPPTDTWEPPQDPTPSFHTELVVRGTNAHALQQGIEQAQQTGLPLRIPRGTYRLSESLIISRPVKIEAEEGAVLVATWDGPAEPNHHAVLQLTREAQGTEIEGLVIDGQNKRLQGVRLRGVSDVKLIDLRAHNLGMNGISIEGGCSQIHVNGAVLEATQQHELSVSGAVWIRDSQDITVENVQVRDTGGKGISVGRSSKVTIRDCVVHDTGIGAGDGIYFAHSHDSLVDRCSVLDPQGNALKISRQSSQIRVQGGHLRKTRGHTGAHAVFIQGGSDNTITGNRIEGLTRRPAVRIEGHPDPEAGGPALRNVVSGNHIVSDSNAAGPKGWFFSPGADHPELIRTGNIYRDNVEERHR